MAPVRARCPTCKEPVETSPEGRPADFPFCSERCRLVDLHRWMTGSYAIPMVAPTKEDLKEILPGGGEE